MYLCSYLEHYLRVYPNQRLRESVKSVDLMGSEDINPVKARCVSLSVGRFVLT